MKNLLRFDREVIIKHDDVVPERDFKVRKRNKNLSLIKEKIMEEVDPTVTKHHQLSSLLNVSPVYSSFLIQDEEDNSQEQTQIDKLRDDINETDLYNYFVGSNHVIIKQCQTASLKYAFILHGTAEEAKHNFAQSIDYARLGSGCRVKYAGNSSCLPEDHQSHDKQRVVVTNIPEDVNEDDLRHLFPNSRVSSYCPARTVLRKTVSIKISGKRKTLWG
ncbi:unnamed protein product [Adineta steineri]|uniref:RRM domain-containing protein n=1 Tax=Adineta steineri TaxID=433720 RepID=A0A815I236_9BILA|nr:unnamed protein product [Adineta steineri]CAF1600488.1 unnamed protein product [Adineta steineri]